MTASDLLTLIVERAPKLREAGVLSVEVEGLKATLAPIQAPEVESGDETPEEQFDVLSDPATFGHTDAERVPGRRRRTQ